MTKLLRNSITFCSLLAILLITLFPNHSMVKAETLLSPEISETQEKIIDQFQEVNSQNEISSQASAFSPNSIVLKYTNGISNEQMKQVEKQFSLSERKKISDLNIYSYKLANTVLSVDLLTDINKSACIEYAEPNYQFEFQSEPDFDKQWSFNNTVNPEFDINYESAWAITKGNPNMVVAVLDSGIDYTHSDLKDRMWINKKEIPGDLIDNDNNGYVDDVQGWDFANKDNDPNEGITAGYLSHATHVAGIIAASENNIGVVGVAPNVQLMNVKVGNRYVEVEDVAPAIEYAVKNGADVINFSVGINYYVASIDEMMKQTSNVVFVCAAGNTQNNGNIEIYDLGISPVTFGLPNVISVASSNKAGSLSSFSNYGPKYVSIAAPGEDIYSTMMFNSYDYWSGTSFAAPHVAGAAALIKSVDPTLSPTEIIDIINKTTTYSPALEGKVKTTGILNVGKAVELANMVNIKKTSTNIQYQFKGPNGGAASMWFKSGEIAGQIGTPIHSITIGGTYSTPIDFQIKRTNTVDWESVKHVNAGFTTYSDYNWTNPIEAIKINVGAGYEKNYLVQYQVYCKGSWQPVMSNGAVAGLAESGYPIEAISITLYYLN